MIVIISLYGLIVVRSIILKYWNSFKIKIDEIAEKFKSESHIVVPTLN